ncbi:MAG: hypothetical protein Q7J68_07870 [Thermoplasmata archaeon]|nr:hypothetical protein [Thermoplasmata archaeon]
MIVEERAGWDYPPCKKMMSNPPPNSRTLIQSRYPGIFQIFTVFSSLLASKYVQMSLRTLDTDKVKKIRAGHSGAEHPRLERELSRPSGEELIVIGSIK